MTNKITEKIVKIAVPLLIGIPLVWSLYFFFKLVYKKLNLFGRYDPNFEIELINYVGSEILFLVLLSVVFMLALRSDIKFLERIKFRTAIATFCVTILLTNFLSNIDIGNYSVGEGAGIFGLYYIFSFSFVLLSIFQDKWLYMASVSSGIPLLLFGGFFTIALIGRNSNSYGYFGILGLLGLFSIYTGYSKWRIQSSTTNILKTVSISMVISIAVPIVFFGSLILVGGLFG